jgi:hypothetical protein
MEFCRPTTRTRRPCVGRRSLISVDRQWGHVMEISSSVLRQGYPSSVLSFDGTANSHSIGAVLAEAGFGGQIGHLLGCLIDVEFGDALEVT